MSDRVVRAIITGDSSGAVRAFGETSAAADDSGSKLGSAFKMAAEAAAVVVAAAVGVGIVAVKMATDFQASQTLLVTGAGESKSNLTMVSNGILAMAGQVGQSAMSLSQGMYLIESAGYHGAAGLAVLKAAAEGASVGNASLTTTADALTTAMHDYNIPVSQANQVTSALIETVASGKTNLDALGSSIGRVLPTASALGVSMGDVLGAMATMTDAGLTAKNAATHLQNTLLALSAPSATAVAALKTVGLTSQDVKNTLDGPSGLSGAIALVTDSVSKKFAAGSVAGVEALKAITGGVTGYSTTLMLSGKNMAGFATNINNINASLSGSGTQVQGFGEVTKDLGFQFDALKDAVGAAMIQFGTRLLPIVSAAMGWFASLLPGAIKILDGAFAFLSNEIVPALVTAFKAVGDWIEKNRRTLLTIAAVAGTVVVGAFKILADIVGFVGHNMQVFGPILAGVAAGFLVLKGVMAFQALTAAPGIFAAIGAVLSGVLTPAEAGASIGAEGLGAAIDLMLGPIGLIIAGIAALVVAVILIVTHFNVVKQVAIDVWTAVLGVVQTVWNSIKGVVLPVVDVLKTAITIAFNVIKDAVTVAVDAVRVEIGIIVLAIEAIVTVVKTVANAIKPETTAIADAFGWVWNKVGLGIAAFKLVFSAIATWLAPVVATIGTIIGKITGFFTTVFGGIAGIVSGVAGAVASAFKGIVDGVIGVINFFIGVIDAAIGGINDALGVIPTFGAGKIQIPTIPKIPVMDTGGIVTVPTLALLAANSRPEAVVPLDKVMQTGAGAVTGGAAQMTFNITSNDPNAVANMIITYVRRNGNGALRQALGIT